MSEMIERVAKAITRLMWRESYDGPDASQREHIKSVAVMAIAAMREPTPEMLGAGYEQICGSEEAQVTPEAALIWADMIDAALKD